MKTKHLLICFLVVVVLKTANAQTYYPLPTQNAYWTVYEWDELNDVYDDKVYSVDGDTLINGMQYTKVYKLNDYPTIYDTIRTLHCFMRQDNVAKRIWFIRHYLGETIEKLGYDLLVAIGDTVNMPAFDYGNAGDSLYIRFDDGLVVLNNGEFRTEYNFSSIVSSTPQQFIEGITNVLSTFPNKLNYWDPFHQTFSVCVEIENNTIWTNGVDTNQAGCGFNLVHIKDPVYNQINIYPNPTNNYSVLELPKILDNIELTIIDLLGKPVFTLKTSTTDYINLDVSRLPSGIYYLQLKTIAYTFYNKLAINH